MDKEKFLKQYQSAEWYETSKRIKARDHNTCQICGRNNVPLSVHHRYYGKNGSLDVPDNALITVCEECHNNERVAKAEIHERVLELINYFNKNELSMSFLEKILCEILQCFETNTKMDFFKNALINSSSLSDVLSLKKKGVDLNDVIRDFYPEITERYNSI